MSDEQKDQGHIKLPDHTHPSDYSDVHPRTYDPEFISQISSQMQVPHRIGVGTDLSGNENEFVSQELPAATHFVGMTVPERIVLAGTLYFLACTKLRAVEDKHRREDKLGLNDEYEPHADDSYPRYPDMSIPYKLVLAGKVTTAEQNVDETENYNIKTWMEHVYRVLTGGLGDNSHIALKQEMELDLSGNSYAASDSMSYVGLITPPRVLTLEERFPVVEETDDQKMMTAHGGGHALGHRTSNGHIGGFTVPYDPGVNLRDPVLLNEENESTLLRTQVSKLTRRIQVIEEDNHKRATRELVLYPLIMGYFLWKILGWLTRDR